MKRIHNKGIIIGDVKMENILIDKNNKPKYIDTDNNSVSPGPIGGNDEHQADDMEVATPE